MKHPVMHRLFLAVSLLMLAPAPASAEMDKPFGRLFPVGGHRLHLHCTGGGSPTVVLEAGIGGNHLDWIRVQPLVAKATTVCSYDRAGYGWSERGPKPRTAGRIADELQALLSAGKVAPPYLLVGHSFGGLIARLFAARRPAQTAGLILVDAMTPEQYEVFAAAGIEVPVEPTRAVIYSSKEVLTYGIPEDYRDLAYRLAKSEKTRSFLYNELRNIQTTMTEVRALDPPEGLPVRVVAHGNRQWDEIYPDGRMEDLWLDMQSKVSAALGGGEVLIARNAGHQAPLDDPGFIAEVILGMVRAQRR